jgi:lipopolysaccharide transport system ATP-binding protein
LIYEFIPKLVLGVKISDKQGHVIWGTNTWHTHQVECSLVTGEMVNYRFKFNCNLGPGSYSLSVALCSSDTHLINNYEWSENLLIFDVVNANKKIFIGSQWMDVDILVERGK